MKGTYRHFIFFAVFVVIFVGTATIPFPAIAQQCNDGIDNDLDGLVDYPADPGCTSLSDETELDVDRVGSYQLPIFSQGVDLSGNYAYVIYSHGGLAVFDVTDPANPELVGQDREFVGDDIEVSGTHAYVVSEDASMLYVVDISDPTAPALVGSCAVTNVETPNSLTVSGNFVYVGAYQYQNMQIFDVSDPSSPHLEGEVIDSRVSCQDIVVANGYAYCPSITISVMNVSDPAHPSFVRTVDTGTTENHWMYGITVSGSTLYATGCYLMMTYDLSDPATPSLLGGVDAGSNCGRRVQVDTGQAFVAQQSDGMAILNVSDPNSPSETGVFGSSFSTQDVAVSGSHAYIADGKGFTIADIGTPSAPTETGSYTETTWYIDVVKSGSLVYAADPDGSLAILDVSDPANPTKVGSYDTGGRPNAVAVAGDDVFVADGDLGLLVVDVTTPSNPTLVSTTALAVRPIAIQVVGNSAFIAEGTSYDAALEIYDVSDPENPSFAGTVSFGSSWLAGGLDVNGNLAYVSLGTESHKGEDGGPYALGIVDITDPQSPAPVTTYTFVDTGDGGPHGIDVRNGLAYVATDEGLFVLDVSTPSAPTIVGSSPESDLTDVQLSGGRAYVSSSYSTFLVYNVLDPTTPYEIGAYEGIRHDGKGLVVDDGTAYLATDYDGLLIIASDKAQLFKDGFESGNTENWSDTVGLTP